MVASAQKLIQKAHIERLSSDFSLVGGETNPINPDGEKVIDIRKIGPNYVNMNQEYTDQSFVLSFMQSRMLLKSKSRSASKYYTNV